MTQRNHIPAAGAASLILLTTLCVLLARPARAQDGQPLLPGVPAQSELTSALGDQWDIYGCAGDVVTVTLASSDFTPYLAVFIDTLEAPIVEAVAEDGEPAEVAIDADATGMYAVIAAGDRRTARGTYTITAQNGDVLPNATEPGATALAYGTTVTGVVQTSAGERLLFHGCAGDAVTVAASSEEFTPFIELFDPTAEETVADSEVVSDIAAMIVGAPLSTTGTYELFVAGQRRSDRGPFTLTLSLATTSTLAPSATAGTPSPTRTPVVVASPTPTSAPSCIILANPLNLRAGPGTNFSPPIGTMRLNSTVVPLARNQDASWIEVETSPARLRGWISADAQFVRCTVEPASLPLGELPPTPTPRPTSTPIPTATPTPTVPPIVVLPSEQPTLPPLVVLPGGGPGEGGWDGAIVTSFGIGNISGGAAVFRDRTFFRAEINSTPNNRRIDHVDFVITDDNGDEVYRRTERVYGYCAFGGGEPNCNVLEIGRDARWPGTDNRIRNGDYNVEARIFLEGDGDPSARWNTPFTINNPTLDSNVTAPGQQNLVVRVAQTGPGTDAGTVYGALVFQVEAYDPARGNRDGDGIRNVELRIFDANGDRVYERTENNAAYCAFAGGEPDCNIFVFSNNGDAWPGGEPIQFGQRYTLRGTANAEDGRSRTVEMSVALER